MQVRVEITNGYTACLPIGALDGCTAAHLRTAMALMSSVPKLVIDLSQVSFIDSAGLSALVSGIRRVRAAGGDVVVCSRRPQVTRVLEMVGFERVVRLVRSMAEADQVLTAKPDVFLRRGA